jgi:hypothetical protein
MKTKKNMGKKKIKKTTTKKTLIKKTTKTTKIKQIQKTKELVALVFSPAGIPTGEVSYYGYLITTEEDLKEKIEDYLCKYGDDTAWNILRYLKDAKVFEPMECRRINV